MGELASPVSEFLNKEATRVYQAFPARDLKTVGQIVGTNEVFLRWKGEM
jgi:hypothetical protein